MENDVGQLLSRLSDGSAPEALGDHTLAPRTYELARQSEIARDFGDEFARQVAALPVGAWSGPVYSPFGAHLVKVEARIDARCPDRIPARHPVGDVAVDIGVGEVLAEIRDEVLREYLAEKSDQQKNLAYEKLRQDYEITVEPLNSRAMPALSSAVAGEIR